MNNKENMNEYDDQDDQDLIIQLVQGPLKHVALE
jgi:hypothetical protein